MKDIFKIFINYSASCGSDYYRAFLPYVMCKDELLKEGIELTIGREFEEVYDAYYLQRLINPVFYPYFMQLRQRKRTIIWDLDDDFWEIPKWSTAKFEPHQLVGLSYCLESADIISTSTDYLRNKLLKYNPNVYTTPNLIDINEYLSHKDKALNTNYYEDDGDFRVLWAGSSTHVKDLEVIIPVVAQFEAMKINDVKFLFIGYMHKDLQQYKNALFFGPGCETRYYPYVIKAISPHVGLAPIVDIEFNRSKSNIKYLEMACCGAVPVCSNVGPYKDAKCFLIDDNTNQTENWFDTIYNIYESYVGAQEEGFRHKMAMAIDESQRDVIDNYSWISRNKQKWVDFFRRAAGREVKESLKSVGNDGVLPSNSQEILTTENADA